MASITNTNEGIEILVVEDDKPTREIVSEMLKKKGYTIDTAEDGKIGFEKAKANIYDLIISDVIMPNLDGRELERELSKEGIRDYTPFMFMTGTAGSHERNALIRTLTPYIVGKPIDMQILYAAIKTALNKPEDFRKYQFSF